MRAVLYARVSSEKQAEKDLSIAAQLKAMRKYATEKGYDIVGEFVDEAESARTANRPKFQEMIARAKQKGKPFDVIIVWKLSRFARNREDSIVFKSLLRKIGVEVQSVSEPIDDSPTGRLLEAMIESMDEFYSANLSQEAKRGLREVAGRGFYPGGSSPVGYKLVDAVDGRAKRKKLVLDPKVAPIVERIFDLCLSGLGAKEITERLNREGLTTRSGHKWSKASVFYILKNPVYTGDLSWPNPCRLKKGEEPIVIVDHHESIVAKHDFKRVQKILSARAPEVMHPQRTASNYLLSGLLFCRQCGKAMIGATGKSGSYRYYSCYSRLRIGASGCTCRPVSTSKLESALVARIQEHILTEENLSELLRLTNEELSHQDSHIDRKIKTLKSELVQVGNRLDRVYTAIESGKVLADDLSGRLRDLNNQVGELKRQIAALEDEKANSMPVKLTRSQLRVHVGDLRALLQEGEFFEQKSFLRSFVKRIELTYPEVVVEYTFPVGLNSNDKLEVLAIGKKSGVDETRTRDLLRDRQAF